MIRVMVLDKIRGTLIRGGHANLHSVKEWHKHFEVRCSRKIFAKKLLDDHSWMGPAFYFLAITMQCNVANLSKELPPNLDQSSSGLVLLMALITIPIPIAITRCAITVPLNLCVPKKLAHIYRVFIECPLEVLACLKTHWKIDICSSKLGFPLLQIDKCKCKCPKR